MLSSSTRPPQPAVTLDLRTTAEAAAASQPYLEKSVEPRETSSVFSPINRYRIRHQHRGVLATAQDYPFNLIGKPCAPPPLQDLTGFCATGIAPPSRSLVQTFLTLYKLGSSRTVFHITRTRASIVHRALGVIRRISGDLVSSRIWSLVLLRVSKRATMRSLVAYLPTLR